MWFDFSRSFTQYIFKQSSLEQSALIMATLSKDALLVELHNNFKKLELELDTLPPVLFNQKTIQGHIKGQQISACDLVAHAIGWTTLAKQWLEQLPPKKQSKVAYNWNELNRQAPIFYTKYNREASFRKLRNNLFSSFSKLIGHIAMMDNVSLFSKPVYQGMTEGQLVQRYVAQLYSSEQIRLRVWKKGLGWV